MNGKVRVAWDRDYFLNSGVTVTPSLTEFNKANQSHINNVRSVMNIICSELSARAASHDNTKIYDPYRSQFYVDVCNSINGLINFNNGAWIREHYDKERHHVDRYVPEDVDLIDIIETLVDVVVSGFERNGAAGTVSINGTVLNQAIQNTLDKITGVIDFYDPEENDA